MADVPAHCAIILMVDNAPVLYEMVSTGWHSRPASIVDDCWAVEVALTDAAGATEFAFSQQGARYGWGTILLIALARLVPARFFRWSRAEKQHICSWFVKAVLEAGLADVPNWLRQQDVPCSPNDLWMALKPAAPPP